MWVNLMIEVGFNEPMADSYYNMFRSSMRLLAILAVSYVRFGSIERSAKDCGCSRPERVACGERIVA